MFSKLYCHSLVSHEDEGDEDVFFQIFGFWLKAILDIPLRNFAFVLALIPKWFVLVTLKRENVQKKIESVLFVIISSLLR